MELGFTFQNEIKILKPKINKYYTPTGNPVGKPKGIKCTRALKPEKEKVRQRKLIYCIYCDCYYQYRVAAQHNRSLKHQNNYLI